MKFSVGGGDFPAQQIQDALPDGLTIVVQAPPTNETEWAWIVITGVVVPLTIAIGGWFMHKRHQRQKAE